MQNDLARTYAEELNREPVLDASRVSVAVRDGVVTLRGAVRSYAEKCRAENIARKSIRPNVSQSDSQLVEVLLGAVGSRRRADQWPG